MTRKKRSGSANRQNKPVKTEDQSNTEIGISPPRPNRLFLILSLAAFGLWFAFLIAMAID